MPQTIAPGGAAVAATRERSLKPRMDPNTVGEALNMEKTSTVSERYWQEIWRLVSLATALRSAELCGAKSGRLGQLRAQLEKAIKGLPDAAGLGSMKDAPDATNTRLWYSHDPRRKRGI